MAGVGDSGELDRDRSLRLCDMVMVVVVYFFFLFLGGVVLLGGVVYYIKLVRFFILKKKCDGPTVQCTTQYATVERLTLLKYLNLSVEEGNGSIGRTSSR